MAMKKIKEKLIRLKWGWKYKNFWKDLFIIYSSKILYRRNKGSSIFSEDWDHLIILDACRYDVFKEEFTRRNMRGDLSYSVSLGCSTPEFLLKNFGNGKFDDIIYITANPYVDMLLRGKFYKIISVWKDGWDDKINTVHPKTVYEYTLNALAKYPNKRFIIHFMQPHYPFITLRLNQDTGIKNLRKAALVGKNVWQEITIWGLVRAGKISLEDAIKAYKQNLRIVLDYVGKLLVLLPGKIIVTADHGEAFGEKLHPLIPFRVYGHYSSLRIEPLVKVPWLIVQNERVNTFEKLEKVRVKKAIEKIKNKL